jgi:hypothetical protein
MRARIHRDDIVWAGQNIAYDFAVLAVADMSFLPDIFRAYDQNRVLDIRIREKLLLLAIGQLADEHETGAKRQQRFSLDRIVLRRFGDLLTAEQKEQMVKDKKDVKSWRLRYSELDGVPLELWPQAAKDYSVNDTLWTDAVLVDQDREQSERTKGETSYIPDEHAQVRAAWWLHLMKIWGIRTDPESVRSLALDLSTRVNKIDSLLKKAGVLKGKYQKGKVRWSKDMKRLRELVVQGYAGAEIPKTDKGAVSTERDTLLQAPMAHQPGCVDDRCVEDCVIGILHAVAERNGIEKVLSTNVPELFRGATVPINPNWNELVATGRTSVGFWQNPPRKGPVRECVIPRPGFVFVSADYRFLELCTLAQVCIDKFGWSKLADAINGGLDPHLDMAADFLGVSYQEAFRRQKESVVKEQRQRSKCANFGLPGGLGAVKFVIYSRNNYGVLMDLAEAKDIKPKWQRKWPEVVPYHKWVSDNTAMGQTFTVKQHRSNRLRGDCGFCDGANSLFQGMAADGAKHAGWFISKECYLDDPYRNKKGPTALHGCRPVLFLHDEFILEVPEDRMHEAAERLVEVMVKAMQAYVPDVKISAEPAAMRRWYKSAEPVYLDGKLVPWEPV